MSGVVRWQEWETRTTIAAGEGEPNGPHASRMRGKWRDHSAQGFERRSVGSHG